MMPKYFTLQEANEALTSIRPWMEEIQIIRSEILVHQPEIWSVMEKSAGNGGNPTLSRMVKTFDRLDALIHSIQDIGAIIKEVNTGSHGGPITTINTYDSHNTLLTSTTSGAGGSATYTYDEDGNVISMT